MDVRSEIASIEKKNKKLKEPLLGTITEVKDLIEEIISVDGFSDAVSWTNSFTVTVERFMTRYN